MNNNKSIKSIILCFAALFLFLMIVGGVSAANTLQVTSDGDVNNLPLSEMDQYFSTTTIDASTIDTILSGSVTLGNFENGNGNDVWYEAGLISDETYLSYSRLHNKGVYMIALWAGTYYKVHMQNVVGHEPGTFGNFLGDEVGYVNLWGDAELCYFKVPSGTFDFEIKYHDVTASGGKFDLRISVDGGITWSGWKYYKYAENDMENFYPLTHEQAVDYGYADDDDLTNARIVSQIFVASSTTETFTALYENIQINGFSYTLEPRVENVNTGKAYAGIQSAIDAASTGDTIEVADGTYAENVVIDKSLSLIGADKTTTIIDGNNIGNAVTITASDVTLTGFKITGGYANGGNIWNSYGGVVINGNSGTSALTNIIIDSNIIDSNKGNGIYVSAAGDEGSADNIQITNCVISNNGGSTSFFGGISLTYGFFDGGGTCDLGPSEAYDEWRRPKNVLIEGNDLSNDISTGYVYGIYVNAGQHNTIRSNDIHGFSSKGLLIAASMPCTAIPAEYTTVEDNEIYNNARNGIKLVSWNQYNTFTGNNIYHNGFGYTGSDSWWKYGFQFKDGNDNIIQDNTITGNALGGLYLWGFGDPSYTWYSTTNNVITGNTISDHTATGGQGIYISAKSGYPNSGFLNSNINQNTIMNNSGYGLENADTTQTIDAENNYFGTAVLSFIQSKISGPVDYSPYYVDSAKTISSSTTPTVVYVDDDYSDGDADEHYFGYDAFTTIQEGIGTVATGGTVNVAAGTYNEEVTINKGITLIGDVGDENVGPGVNAPVLDGQSVLHDAFTISAGVSDVTIKGFEIKNYVGPGNGVGNAIQAWNSGTSNIEISDNYMHNLDWNGILVGNDGATGDHSGWTIKNNILEDYQAYGLELTNSYNSVIENNLVHASNSWTGILTVARRNEAGITIKNNIIDGVIDSGTDGRAAIYILAWDAGEGITNPTLDDVRIENNEITTSGTKPHIRARDVGGEVTNLLINQNILSNLKNDAFSEVNAEDNYWGTASPDFGSIVSGSVDYTPWYATSTTTPITQRVTVKIWATEDVRAYSDTIQSAIAAASSGDTINVAAGTYNERIVINKPLTLKGATYNINKNGYEVPVGYDWDDTVESIIQPPTGYEDYDNIIIDDSSDVTIEGFVIQALERTSTSPSVTPNDRMLVHVLVDDGNMNNLIIRNNVIGPNTNTVSQDGKKGRMNIDLDINPYSASMGLTNSLIAGNKIFGSEGNGNAIFIWASYYAYGATDSSSMEGTIIEDNEICCGHRSGIETAGGFSGLTIRNNNIHDFSSLPTDTDSNLLKYGNGIVLIRGSGDRSTCDGFGPEDLTIQNNQIYDNEKNGIYMGPINKNYQIINNNLYGNGWNGIRLDLIGNYWNPDFDPNPGPYTCLDGSESIVANSNKIQNNIEEDVRIIGTPTNDFILNATYNYWGEEYPNFTIILSGDVSYKPWYIDSALTMLLKAKLEENQTLANSTDMTVNENATEIVVPVGSPLQNVTIPASIPSDKQVSLNLSDLKVSDANSTNVTLSNNLSLTRKSSTYNYSVTIPANTTVSGNTSWNGMINLPTVKSSSGISPTPGSGNSSTVTTVIEIGYGDIKLTFDKAVRILIEGQAGKYAGYTRAGAFYEITTECTADTQTAGDALDAEGDCKISSGSDLVIWTKHFTSFVTYTQSAIPAPAATAGGAGGGGGCFADWTCSDWSECSAEGIQTRTCTNSRLYCTIGTKPAESQACTYIIPTTPAANVTTPITPAITPAAAFPVGAAIANLTRVTGKGILDIAKQGYDFAKSNRKMSFSIVIVAIILVFLTSIPFTARGHYKKAEKLHRKAEAYYNKGNFARANALFNKAQICREKGEIKSGF